MSCHVVKIIKISTRAICMQILPLPNQRFKNYVSLCQTLIKYKTTNIKSDKQVVDLSLIQQKQVILLHQIASCMVSFLYFNKG